MAVSEVRCPCGVWVYGPPGSDVPGWSTAGGPTRRRRAYCLTCHSELGERDGAPVVEPMVPRAALEWLAERAGGKFNDCPVGATGDYEMLPADWCQERMVQYDGETAEQECKQGRGECAVADCWVQSALAAAEEADGE
jgi:hypothetical protein